MGGHGDSRAQSFARAELRYLVGGFLARNAASFDFGETGSGNQFQETGSGNQFQETGSERRGQGSDSKSNIDPTLT